MLTTMAPVVLTKAGEKVTVHSWKVPGVSVIVVELAETSCPMIKRKGSVVMAG